MQGRITKIAAVGALALGVSGLAACGGGGGSSSSGGGAVKVWMSVDPAVFAGLKKQIESEASSQNLKVDVQKVDNINQLIMTKLQAGDAPDIALIPQPGVVGDIVSRNQAQPLDDVIDSKNKDDMTPGTLEAGTFDDKLYGFLVSMNVKSLVFYPKKAWDKAGYKAPTSLDELDTLTEKIKSDGTPPWCFAIGSDAATGWPATDWFEDLILQQQGIDTYNKWVKHEINFDSPEVREAADEFDKLLLTDGNVAGGRGSIASTAFGDADNPMWDAKPGCMMLKQGNFIISPDFLPKNVVSNVDANVGVFGFPPGANGGGALGGGDLATLLSDSADAKKVMNILAEPTMGKEAAPTSSFISPHTSFDASLYPNDLTRSIADVAYKAQTFAFDGSDQMPGAVGAGAFWKDMTAYISGQEDLDTALKNIDSAWPST